MDSVWLKTKTCPANYLTACAIFGVLMHAIKVKIHLHHNTLECPKCVTVLACP